MNEAENTQELNLPPNLQNKLEEFRSRLWAVKIAEGALAAIFGLAVSYLLIFLLDRVIDTPTWLRWIILIAGAAVPGIGLPLRWHKWVWQQRSLEQVARLLRKRFPRLGDELLGIVELAHRGDGSQHSRVLVQAAMKQVDQKVADQDFSDAVPNNRQGRWTLAAIGAIGLAVLTIVFASPAARNAMARWMMPWKSIDRYTFAKVNGIPDKMVVPFAEPFELNTKLKKDTEWSPEKGTAKVPGGKPIVVDQSEGGFEFDLPPLKEAGDLFVKIGDIREKVAINPLTRPELVDLKTKIQLPDYLLYSYDPEIQIRGGSVAVVKGAEASIFGTASRDLKEARIDGSRTLVEGASFKTVPTEITESFKKELTWEDVHGLTAKDPLELRINAVDDESPDVFAQKTTREQVILEDEVVSFDIAVSDDFGVKKVGIEWIGVKDAIHNPEPAKGDKLVSAGEPEKKEIEALGTFSAARENVKPQTLQLRAFAEDYLPGRDRSYSPTFIVHVMNPDDHAQWLTEQFGKWFRNARETYEKEQQLHEANRELRKLSADELDRPENRRKVEKQASAESNNGRRLDSLNGAGKELVRQATKNNEFDAERLETWATMLKSLDDIAKKRMPSVSDLLKQAAAAPGKQSAGKPSNGKPQEPQESSPSSPSDGKPKEGEPQEPSKNSKPSGPIVKNDNSDQKSKGGKAPEMEKSDKKSLPVPQLSDKESGFMEQVEQKEDPNAPKKKPSPGKLSLPSTVLQGVASKKKDEETKPAESPAQEKLDIALEEQQKLLDEFAKVADQLQELLASLEASTFVKRFKAASRKQLAVATDLNSTLVNAFGVSKDKLDLNPKKLAEDVKIREDAESAKIYTIQTDLSAYFQRKQDTRYKKILDEMRDTGVVNEVKEIGESVKVNFNGRSIAAAEFWGDTLDRWAEELVSASDCKACKGGSSDSLPPELVLKVMKILHGEMALRDETREAEGAKSGLQADEFLDKVEPLELTQADLREKTDEVITDIMDLPNAQSFGKEVQLLTAVSDVMRAARGILARPDTGPEAIAAETEAIELLLMAKRQNPKGGGGGGSNPGGGGQGTTSAAALADIGSGDAKDAGESQREIGQSTGRAGREFPEEFRGGLDSYFNSLEGSSRP